MYTLRQATTNDYDFLYKLHVATIREYVEATWGWQEEWQKEYFDRKFDPQDRQIIQIDGEDAGVIAIERRDEELFVALIEILPDYQNRGIGTSLLRHVIQKAHKDNLPVRLQVLKTNAPAHRLYERLGFVTIKDEDYRYIMVCSPEDEMEK